MLARRAIVLGAACAAFATAAKTADASARAFLAAIYEKYRGKNAPGIALDKKATIERYFEPNLAALINKDQSDAARRNETSALDGDPFVDAQDWDIADLKISVGDTVAGKTQATVTFQNTGEPRTVIVDLVKIKNDWRISDITWRHDGKAETLRGLYKR
jgi:hypothetical protein